jgi:TIR domain-containing protein/patatin-like phospholipase
MPDVFMSYRSEDRDLILPFVKQLGLLGLDVWFDQQIRVGERWDGSIDENLKAARCVIVFWTQRSVQSAWVMFESIAAQQRNALIPVFLENCEAPGPLAFVQGARLAGWYGQPEHDGWLKLLAETERLLSRSDLVPKERSRAAAERENIEKASSELSSSHAVRRPIGHFRSEKLNRSRRRILSIDGAGPRALLSLEYLKTIERLLGDRSNDPSAFVLSDYFDLIGGTSVGGLIAASLALGMRVDEIETILSGALLTWYSDQGLPPPVFSSRDVNGSITQVVASIAGDRKLDSNDLRTGFAACTKRLDTGTTWIITNNPLARYWKSSESNVGNQDLLLREVLRGCIASPGRLEACSVQLHGSFQPSIFVDGIMGGLADPSYHLLMTATLPPFGLNWQTGVDKLLLISIGSGWSRSSGNPGSTDRILQGMIHDTMSKNVMTMQTLGSSEKGWAINSELGDMRDCLMTNAPLFLYKKYDVILDRLHLGRDLGVDLSQSELDALRSNDKTSISAQRLGAKIGKIAAAHSVHDENFPILFDTRFEE